MNLPISVYTQIGVVLLIALAAKNAILIVEFARDYRAAGKSTEESAIEGGRVRLRPILMTSFAFILGTFPLVISTGAGASSRISLGIAGFCRYVDDLPRRHLVYSQFLPDDGEPARTVYPQKEKRQRHGREPSRRIRGTTPDEAGVRQGEGLASASFLIRGVIQAPDRQNLSGFWPANLWF